MRTVSAGDFAINISDPYPVWVELNINGEIVKSRFSHRQLMDLKHCVDEAIRHARLELKKFGADPEEVSSP